MLTCEEIRDYRNEHNVYAKFLGIKTLTIKPGYAQAELVIRAEHLNHLGSVHGGCLFSLADVAAGSAASSNGMKMTTMTTSLNYLSAAINVEKLYGIAKELKGGRNVSYYDVTIVDNKGTLIAKGDFSFFNLKKPIELD